MQLANEVTIPRLNSELILNRFNQKFKYRCKPKQLKLYKMKGFLLMDGEKSERKIQRAFGIKIGRRADSWRSYKDIVHYSAKKIERSIEKEERGNIIKPKPEGKKGKPIKFDPDEMPEVIATPEEEVEETLEKISQGETYNFILQLWMDFFAWWDIYIVKNFSGDYPSVPGEISMNEKIRMMEEELASRTKLGHGEKYERELTPEEMIAREDKKRKEKEELYRKAGYEGYIYVSKNRLIMGLLGRFALKFPASGLAKVVGAQKIIEKNIFPQIIEKIPKAIQLWSQLKAQDANWETALRTYFDEEIWVLNSIRAFDRYLFQ